MYRVGGRVGDAFDEESDRGGTEFLGGQVDGGEARMDLFGPVPGHDSGEGEPVGAFQSGVVERVPHAGQGRLVDRHDGGCPRVGAQDLLDAALARLRVVAAAELDPGGVAPGDRLPESLAGPAGRPVARLTSAAFGYSVRRSLGFAYLPADVSPTDRLEVEILGKQVAAQVLESALYDPNGERLRS